MKVHIKITTQTTKDVHFDAALEVTTFNKQKRIRVDRKLHQLSFVWLSLLKKWAVRYFKERTVYIYEFKKKVFWTVFNLNVFYQ